MLELEAEASVEEEAMEAIMGALGAAMAEMAAMDLTEAMHMGREAMGVEQALRISICLSSL